MVIKVCNLDGDLVGDLLYVALQDSKDVHIIRKNKTIVIVINNN